MIALWAPTYLRFPQVPFKRIFMPVVRPIPPNAEIVTAYTNGVVTLRSNRRTDGYHEARDVSTYRGVEPGDFVVHGLDILRGSVGVSDSRGAMSPVCTVCVLVGNDDPRFMAYAIQAQAHHGFTRVMARGIREGGADFRRWETLAELPLPRPAPDIQRKLADYLDTETARIDALIAKKRRLASVLAARRMVLASELVAEAKPQTTGARLKHVVRGVVQGWSPQCDNTVADGVLEWGVLKAGAANGGVFRPTENKRLAPELVPRPELAVRPGQLVVSRANTRDLVGSAAVVENEFPRLMLCDKLYALELDVRLARPEWVSLVLGTPKWRGLIELEASGASPSMQNISLSDILNLPMDLPPVDQQDALLDAYEVQARNIGELMAKLERSMSLMVEHRQALITAAVTGELEVPGVAA